MDQPRPDKTTASLFDRLEWRDDRVLIDDLVFRLELSMEPDCPDWSDGRFFKLFKPRELVEQYRQLFPDPGQLAGSNILEVGMYDGGSLVLLNELFEPAKLVGIDIQDRSDSEYFQGYIAAAGRKSRIRTFWKTSQTDFDRLEKIIASEFSGPLDLVIDDASHYYEETRATFEFLYPRLKPGGIYVIEDWQWSHWPEFQTHSYFDGKLPLTKLIVQLIEFTGSAHVHSPARVEVRSRMALIIKGTDQGPAKLNLAEQIIRR